MNFDEAKQYCLDKWRHILDDAGQVSLKTFLEEVTEACAFCDIAAEKQRLAREQGERHTSVQCLFCDAYIRFGGCRERIDQLMSAALNEDWEATRQHVQSMIAWLESMDEAPQLEHEFLAQHVA